jgi:hypothetical protein
MTGEAAGLGIVDLPSGLLPDLSSFNLHIRRSVDDHIRSVPH